jgi:ABC-2 type transport system permease protein
MLQSYGITVTQALVMDPQNEPFPVAVNRDVGGMQVREIQAISYPFFVDVRNSGMDKNSPVVANLPAVTMHWASPLTVDAARNSGRTVVSLLKSTTEAWLRTNTDIQPNLQLYPELGFPVEGARESHILAVSVQGSFDSFFVGKPSPLTATPADATQPAPAPVTAATIESSPNTSRLVVIGSAEFVDDLVFQVSANLTQDRYLNSLQFMQNAVDWSVEDLDLLTIRSRGTQSRVLKPMATGEQSTWEVANYALALLALAAIGAVWTMRRRNEKPMTLVGTGE